MADVVIDAASGNPVTVTLAMEMIAHVAHLDLGALPPGMEPGLEVVHRYKSDLLFLFSNACHLCTVEIDPQSARSRCCATS
jgi:hypothetical protein